MNKGKISLKDRTITITGRHVHVTEGMKQHAFDKVSKIEVHTGQNHFLDISVIMDIQKTEHRASIILQYDHIKIKATSTTSDMYISINKAVEKIENQLIRFKGKLQDHHAKGHAVVNMQVEFRSNPFKTDDDINSAIEEQNEKELEAIYKPHSVVSQKVIPLKTLTFDEAIMKMELSQDNFLIFREEKDLKLKVIYKREDGNYGIISVE